MVAAPSQARRPSMADSAVGASRPTAAVSPNPTCTIASPKCALASAASSLGGGLGTGEHDRPVV